jgi:deoxyhypusine synthase
MSPEAEMGHADKPKPFPERKESIDARTSKVHLGDFAQIPRDFSWFAELRKMIPNILRGRDLEELSQAIASAHRESKPVIWMMGAHVLKCGLGGLVCHLVREGIVTGLATNGAGAIHDLEIAMWGKTSEDVGEGLRTGMFGTTAETARLFNGAARTCLEAHTGLGKGLGQTLLDRKAPNQEVSVLATASRAGIPITVHVAIGTDVVHEHDDADGQAIGYASMEDFRTFTSMILDLRGGVVLNVGSAVIMPEVFLKALAIARNRGADLGAFTTANFDMFALYRALTNVVERPRLIGATTYNFIGNHEITLPVLIASVLSRI